MRMIDHPRNEEAVFLAALEENTPEARTAYTVRACAGDTRLRQRVLDLLASHAESLGPLDTPPPGLHSNVAIADASVIGEQIGLYTLLEQIGEGGFGVVYRAEQARPVKRQVALKIVKPGMETSQVLARFGVELQALSLMDHPNIARALDAGATESGRPYFVMELARGLPITEYCDEHRLSIVERLELFVAVCRAVQHAHQKGIIHRDLKPSNVLVTLQEGKPVPKVIDFGVAKAIDRQLIQKEAFTRIAEIIGTPQYMSPEQAERSGVDIDTRTDIYSLGVLLYELLAGSTPFDPDRLQAASYDEIRRIVREKEPERPSERLNSLERIGITGSAGAGQPGGVAELANVAARRRSEPRELVRLLRGELDWIVMRCLEKDRSRRYETATGLQEDVRRYLNDEPVQACPPTAWYRFCKFARRNKVALAMSSVIAAAVLAAVTVLATSSVMVARALDAETVAKESLSATLERERGDSYFHRIALADRELGANNLGRALQLLDECPADLRDWEWHYLMRLCRVEPLIVHGTTEFNGVSFSPDGRQLASAGGDGTIRIFDSKTGQVEQSFAAHAGYVSCVVFHQDGQHLASVGADRLVHVWDLRTGTSIFSRQCDAVHVYGTTYTAAFSPDGNQLAAGQDGVVNLWDWRHDQLVRELPGHEKTRICVAFDGDGRLATGTWWGTTRLWDLSTGEAAPFTLTDPHASHHPVSALAFDSTGERLAESRYDRRVYLWDTKTGQYIRELPHAGLVLAVACSPDGRRLASAGEEKTVRVWDPATGREVLDLRGHTGMCCCVAFSPDGRRLATASKDKTIRVWDASPLQGHEGQEVLTFTGHEHEIWTLNVSPDGQRVVSGGFSTATRVWDLMSGRVNVEFNGHPEIEFSVAWSPDGERIASAGGDRSSFQIKVWNSRTGREVFTIPGNAQERSEYFGVVFSPDGRHLVTGGADKSLKVWDAQTGGAICTLGLHDRMIRGVLFSRDGRWLASVSDDGIVKFWDATRLSEPQTSETSVRGRVHGHCLNVGISPDGARAATGAEDSTVKVWDVASGAELRTLRGHSGDIYAVAFSPDPEGRWIASAGEDSTVKVWDSTTGEQVHSFRGHTGLVSSLAFTPDGQKLVSGSRDHTVRVWDVSHFRGSANP